jgi:hypothetical protein
MTSVRIRNNAVASALDKSAYSMRGSCTYGVRQTIAERRAGSLRMAASHLLLQANSPHLSMREALPGDGVGRVFLSRAFLLREACGPRTRARRARVSSIHSFISWALSAAWAATISRPVTYVSIKNIIR